MIQAHFSIVCCSIILNNQEIFTNIMKVRIVTFDIDY